MTAYVALLRAVNVGGTGKLAMADLKALCIDAGFTDVQTYIASGNVVFTSKAGAKTVKALLDKRLEALAGKPIGVLLRTAGELADVLAHNPFPTRAANRTVAVFLDAAPPADALAHAKGVRDEEMRLGKREIYIHYGSGVGTSKLKIPAALAGTARNMNTIAKLATMASAL